MIGDKQQQEVAESGTAIQSGRDTTINHGLSTDDVRAIIESMADQLPKYTAVAASIVEERLKTFEEKLISKFESDLSDHRKAFEDPDFQLLLRSAQATYSRSGDEQTFDNLINLIGERSKSKGRSRMSLSMNAAVERAGVLTRNEFAELSYVFFVAHVRQRGMRDLGEVARFFQHFLDPLLPDLSTEPTSYSYLEAMGCANVSIGETEFQTILVRKHPNLFIKGFDITELITEIGDAAFARSLIDAGLIENRFATTYVPAPLSAEEFENAVGQAGFDPDRGNAAWAAMERKAMSADEIRAALLPFGFDIGPHFQIWNETLLKRLMLTSIGTAIGHSNLKRIAQFPADLSIWIK